MNSLNVRKCVAKKIPQSLRRYVPPKISQHLYFKGIVPVTYRGEKILNVRSNGYFLETQLYFYGLEGGHEKKSMQIWIEYCQKFNPQNVYDIGANTGIYGLVAKAFNPNSVIHFFEPIPKAVEILQSNLEINNYSANVFNIALSNYDGDGHIYMSHVSDFAYSVTLNNFADLAITGSHQEDSTFRKIDVKVAQISTLLINGVIGKPNLVKIDVETHEHEVLEGFKFDLSEVDAFLIEVLTEEVASKLNLLFSGLNFRYFNIDDKNSMVQETSKVYVSDQYNYFLIQSDLVSLMQSLQN